MNNVIDDRIPILPSNKIAPHKKGKYLFRKPTKPFKWVEYKDIPKEWLEEHRHGNETP